MSRRSPCQHQSECTLTDGFLDLMMHHVMPGHWLRLRLGPVAANVDCEVRARGLTCLIQVHDTASADGKPNHQLCQIFVMTDRTSIEQFAFQCYELHS